MNNKGKITVFVCLIMSGLIMLGLTSINIINIYMAKEKVSIAAKTAVSNIKSNYNSYIFEQYHILLFDKTGGGRGEAALEQMMESSMKNNLGDEFQIELVAISDLDMLIDNDCEALKEQIRDYMGYGVVEYGVQKILDATDGKDGEIPEDVERRMDSENEDAQNEDVQNEDTQNEDTQNEGGGTGEPGIDEGGNSDVSDPRKVTKKAQKKGLLSIVLPDDLELSDNIIELASMPSLKYTGISGVLFKINADFDDYDDFKSDIHSHEKWADKLVDSGVGAAYARDVFNCATDKGRNENTVLCCELEYLICGKACDYDNLEGVVGKITAIRLPINYVYLLSDVEKMSKVKSIALPLSFITLIPAPILKYLIAGCWAYGESLMEVRNLLQGKKLEFAKSSSNWITDIDNFESSIKSDTESSKRGLVYQDYLMILMALDMDTTYYRMLDLMQVNVNNQNEENNDFKIENSVVNISFDIKALHGGRQIFINCSGGY